MTIVGEDNTDIKLDANGQPVPDKNGDFATVSGDECWEQDLRLEAHTEEGELFYEDEDGDEAYGFGLRGKLAKRTYLDLAKTTQEVTFRDGIYYDSVPISKNDSNDEYNMELSTEEVEVESE